MIDQLGLKYATGKSSAMCNYLSFYGMLGPFISPDNLLEIGVQYGNSIKMWRELYPDAEITGIDCYEHNPPITEGTIIHGNAYTLEMVQRFTASFDVIIDDGSHALADQQFVVANYSRLIPHLGILVIEDVANMAFAAKLRQVVPAGFDSAAIEIRPEADMILFLVWRKPEG